jgi:hypothetical protein
MITEMRLSDGYISATKMCQSAGKMWGHYKDVARNKEFMIALAESTGRPLETLLHSILSGPNHQRGTWVHPQLATHLAMWISTEFEVKVSRWIESARRRLPQINQDYMDSLKSLKPRRANDVVEAHVRDRLAESEKGQVEVLCDYGIVDVLTSSEIIEVKRSRNFLHALGQVLGYAESFPEHKKRVHLILEDNEEERLSRAKRICSKHGVKVTCEIVKDTI